MQRPEGTQVLKKYKKLQDSLRDLKEVEGALQHYHRDSEFLGALTPIIANLKKGRISIQVLPQGKLAWNSHERVFESCGQLAVTALTIDELQANPKSQSLAMLANNCVLAFISALNSPSIKGYLHIRGLEQLSSMNARVVLKPHSEPVPILEIIITDLADNIARQYASPIPGITAAPEPNTREFLKLRETFSKSFRKKIRERLSN